MHKKLRSYSSPTHLMGGTLIGWSGRWVFIQSSSSWVFQFFLLNLAEESQVNDYGREYIEDIRWSAMWLIFCQVWVPFLSDADHTDLHKNRFASPPPLLPSPSSSPWLSSFHTDLYFWHPVLTWWVLGGSNFCFVPRSKAATALNW